MKSVLIPGVHHDFGVSSIEEIVAPTKSRRRTIPSFDGTRDVEIPTLGQKKVENGKVYIWSKKIDGLCHTMEWVEKVEYTELDIDLSLMGLCKLYGNP